MTKKKKISLPGFIGIKASEVPKQPVNNPQPPPYSGNEPLAKDVSFSSQWGQVRTRAVAPAIANTGSIVLLTVKKEGYLQSVNLSCYVDYSAGEDLWLDVRLNDGNSDIPLVTLSFSYSTRAGTQFDSIAICPNRLLVKPGYIINVRYSLIGYQKVNFQAGCFVQNINDFS